MEQKMPMFEQYKIVLKTFGNNMKKEKTGKLCICLICRIVAQYLLYLASEILFTKAFGKPVV